MVILSVFDQDARAYYSRWHRFNDGNYNGSSIDWPVARAVLALSLVSITVFFTSLASFQRWKLQWNFNRLARRSGRLRVVSCEYTCLFYVAIFTKNSVCDFY